MLNPPTRWATRVKHAVFTNDYKQGRRMAVVLMTAAVYVICAALLVYGASQKLFEPAARLLAGGLLAAALTFVVLFRSGVNLHFAHPSLALPQSISAQTLVVLAYAVSGPVHPSTLVLLAMVMVFGMFEMDTRRVWLLLAYTIAMMTATMAWCVATRPLMYPRRTELIHFAIMITALPAISTLSVQLANMRSRLRLQKAELVAALEQIRMVATHDELTGLSNRRHMLSLLAEHAARFARGGPGFAVALADIDHFKNVNDTYGHRIGDDALKFFAQQARVHLRSTDIAARWGGEEFLLLLAAAPPGDPNIGIERLRGALAVAQASPSAPHLRIAFSTGLTRYVAGESIDDLIERADKALYLAKNSGRNQTRVAFAEAANPP
ncbi:MAG: diguanylate cyclase [Telluria sp.]